MAIMLVYHEEDLKRAVGTRMWTYGAARAWRSSSVLSS